MQRRDFLSLFSLISAAIISKSITACSGKEYHLLLRNSWQTINIGDIGHTPGILHLFEEYIPRLKVTLWPGSVSDGVEEMLLKRFPALTIIHTEEDIQKAFAVCDFFLHGSGPYIVGDEELIRWREETGRPYGIYGITFTGSRNQEIDFINNAQFAYFRDSVSLQRAREKGAHCPLMEFCPDSAFAVDLRDEAAALKFLHENNLQQGQFVCCIPRLRYTQNWLIPVKNRALNPVKHARNEEMKEHDHRPLREAITAIARQTDFKVLICPEDVTQMQVGREVLYDRLAEDVKNKVVWRSNFWLTDEALSTYIRSAGLFGNEMHSPIMCIGNGIPAIVCRFKEQTSKGTMWNDIGLSEWLFDLDNETDYQKIVRSVLQMINNPAQSKKKVIAAQNVIKRRQRETMTYLKETIQRRI
jgi:polysaccharide pyruvyl transferase WcaK-like protein